MDIDQRSESEMRTAKFHHEWDVSSYFRCSWYTGLESPEFRFDRTNWYMKFLHKKIIDNSEELFVSVFLYLKSCQFTSRLTTNYFISFTNCAGETIESQKICNTFNAIDKENGHETMFRRNEVRKLFEKNQILKVVCDIEINKEFISKIFPTVSNQTADKFKGSILDDLADFFDNSENFDIILKGNDGFEVKAHKFMLITRSRVFKELIEQRACGLKEIIVLNDFEDTNCETVKLMVQFLYKDRIEVNEVEEIKNLLIAADKYQIIKLKNLCENFLIKTVQLDTFAEMLVLSNMTDCEELKKSILEKIRGKGTEAVTTNTWIEQVKNNPTICQDALYSLVGIDSSKRAKIEIPNAIKLDICETSEIKTNFRYLWMVKNFLKIENYQKVYSPEFSFSKTRWMLRLDTNDVAVYLILKGCGFSSSITVNCTFSLTDKFGKTLDSENFLFKLKIGEAGRCRKIIETKQLRNLLEEQKINKIQIICDITIKDPIYNERSLVDDLSKCYRLAENLDVQLKGSDGVIVEAHKFVLIARSKVFKAMFDHNTEEKEKDFVDIEDINGETLKSLVQFLYTDKIYVLMADKLINLLIAADKYQISKLKSLCEQNLILQAEVENVADILALCNMVDCKELRKHVLELFKANAKEVVQTKSWIERVETNPMICQEALEKYLE